MSIKFLVLGGGGILGLGGGGSADFIFMGAGIFLIEGACKGLQVNSTLLNLFGAGKRKTYTGTGTPHFSKKATQWGKNGRYQ